MEKFASIIDAAAGSCEFGVRLRTLMVEGACIGCRGRPPFPLLGPNNYYASHLHLHTATDPPQPTDRNTPFLNPCLHACIEVKETTESFLVQPTKRHGGRLEYPRQRGTNRGKLIALRQVEVKVGALYFSDEIRKMWRSDVKGGMNY